MGLNKNKTYGVVEGFFSRPLPIWTNKERVNIINFLSDNSSKINFYYYCPKQDKYVVEKWNYLYPNKNLHELKEIVNLCTKNKIKFAFGLNPSIPENFNKIPTDEFLNEIYTKINQLLSI